MKHMIHICKALFLGLLLASCGRADRMRSLLEQAEWMNQHDSLFTSDSVGRALVRYYDHWWHPADLRLRAYYMLGCAYRDMGNAPRALENYQLAAAQVDTLTAPDSTLNRLMRVHSQMSQIYLLQRLPEQEKQELQIAERLAWRTGDTLSALIFEGYLCNILFDKKEFNACINNAKVLYQKYISAGYKKDAPIAYIYCFKSHMALKEYKQAKKYLELYKKCPYFETDPKIIVGGIGSLYIYEGQYFLGTGQADSARHFFQKALPYKESGDNTILTYRGLNEAYAMLHIPDSVVKYSLLYSDAKEKSFDEAQTTATIQARHLYDYSIEQTEAKAKTKANAHLTLIILVLIFAFAVAFFVFLYYREKKKRDISELRQKHQKAILDLRELELCLQNLQKEKSQNENLIAGYLQEKELLEKRIIHYEQEIATMASWEKKVNLENSEIVCRIRRYRNGLRTEDSLNESHWLQLKHTIENICPSFYPKLNATQKLTEIEYRVCLLLKIGFNPSDIDILLDKSHSFATKVRNRLLKKVLNMEGEASKFDKFVRDLW